MITVKENEDKLLIKCATSTFTYCMTYCEHRIPFYKEGIKPPIHEESETRKMIGSIFHAKEEKKDKEKVIPLTKEELNQALPNKQANVEFTREHIFSKLTYSMSKDNKNIQLILTGRPDKLFRKDELLIVEEDKFPKNPYLYVDRKYPFDNHLLQSLIYLNSKFSLTSNNKANMDIEKNLEKNTIKTSQCTINMFFDIDQQLKLNYVNKNDSGEYIKQWFEIPHKKKKWIVNIRDFESGDKENNIVKRFEGIQDENDEIFLQEKITRFISIIADNEQRYHHGNFKKCIPCEYSDICKFSLING